jgi:hypothetical protein
VRRRAHPPSTPTRISRTWRRSTGTRGLHARRIGELRPNGGQNQRAQSRKMARAGGGGCLHEGAAGGGREEARAGEGHQEAPRDRQLRQGREGVEGGQAGCNLESAADAIASCGGQPRSPSETGNCAELDSEAVLTATGRAARPLRLQPQWPGRRRCQRRGGDSAGSGVDVVAGGSHSLTTPAAHPADESATPSRSLAVRAHPWTPLPRTYSSPVCLLLCLRCGAPSRRRASTRSACNRHL